MFTVQSVVLPKNKYSLEEAKKEILKLGYNNIYRGKEVNEYIAGQTINYWRFRQKPPSQFIKDSFRIKKINNGGFLVLGKLK